MTSLPGSSFTTEKDTIVDIVGNHDTTFDLAGAGYGDYDAILTSLQLTEGDTLDGGAGIDTLRIVQTDSDIYGYLAVDLTSFASLTGIENIVVAGNANSYALIQADQRSLTDIERIDGGLSYTTLVIEGGVIDLRRKTIVDISSITFSAPSPTIQFDSVETARTVMSLVSSPIYGATVVLEDGAFTAADRANLFEQGVQTITDSSGTYGYGMDEGGVLVEDKLIGNLDGDHIYDEPGNLPVRLDAGFDTLIDPSGELPSQITVYALPTASGGNSVILQDGVTLITLVPVETSPAPEIPGNPSMPSIREFTIKIGEKSVGTLQYMDQVGGLSISFTRLVNPETSASEIFSTPLITAEELQSVIRALHYTGTGALGSQDEISITLGFGDASGWRSESYIVTAHAIPAPAKVLTTGIDVATGAVGNDDVFAVMRNSLTEGDSIDGGVGDDTLWMIESGTLDLRLPSVLNSIEAVRGTDGNDTIYVNAERLAGLNAIDGGGLPGYDYDRLVITGDVVDFRNVEISGFEAIEFRATTATLHFANVAQALLFMDDIGTRHVSSHNLEAVLDIDDISEEDQVALFDIGFSKITDGTGQEYTWGEPGFPPGVPAGDPPVLKFLDGDRVTAGWNTSVRLDAGMDAIVENPEGKLNLLIVSFSEHLRRSQGHNAEMMARGR